MAKILIVDDKKENREVLLNFFRFFGRKAPIEIDEAASGKEAVEKASTSKPDLILMDVNMETTYAGLDATKEIKTKYGKDIKIWAVTSQAMKGYEYEDSDEAKCLAAGCDKYISKPFDQKKMLFEISDQLDIPIPDRVRETFNE
ncbi:MAG TPA: response regulator [Spirochaetota bacterium]|nr:response regulator [Spirochaetota bacterium]